MWFCVISLHSCRSVPADDRTLYCRILFPPFQSKMRKLFDQLNLGCNSCTFCTDDFNWSINLVVLESLNKLLYMLFFVSLHNSTPFYIDCLYTNIHVMCNISVIWKDFKYRVRIHFWMAFFLMLRHSCWDKKRRQCQHTEVFDAVNESYRSSCQMSRHSADETCQQQQNIFVFSVVGRDVPSSGAKKSDRRRKKLQK